MKTILSIGILVSILITSSASTTYVNSATSEASQKHITISRFDKALFQYINNPSPNQAKNLTDNYRHTLTALAQTINNTNNPNNALPSLVTYFSHPTLKNIYKDAILKFDNLDSYQEALATMSDVAEKEFGTTTLPQFSTHVSGFKENTIYINNTISLSIDKYMGGDYAPYKGYFKPYQLLQMQPKMIVRDFTKAWLMIDYIKIETTNGDMLSEMIEHGKLLYALSILLPQYTEYDLIGYTDQEYNWCINNHKKLWDSIIKQSHLYTTDRHIIYTYFDEAPNNKIFMKDAPGQIGSWIGLQIVKQYAKESKQKLSTIINTDCRTILKEAKYRQ